MLYYFHTLIDYRLNPRLFKRNLILGFSIFLTMLIIYILLLVFQWNAMDFSIALEGACPKCATQNWCLETIFQDTSLAGFPAILTMLAIRTHKFDYNPSYFWDNFPVNSFRPFQFSKLLYGLIRLVICFIAWCPIVFWWFPHFSNPVAVTFSTIVKNFIGAFLFYIVAPYLLKVLKMDMKGDVQE